MDEIEEEEEGIIIGRKKPQNLSYAHNVRPLFNDQSKRFFDMLGVNIDSCEDMRRNAFTVYEHLYTNSLGLTRNCELVVSFRDWMTTGMQC